MYENNQQQRPKGILDDKKYRLKGKPTEGGTPTLDWGVFNGQPSASVWTNDPQDPERKAIRAAFGVDGWRPMIEFVLDFAENGSNGESRRMELRTGPPNKTFPQSVFIVGKEENGVIWVAIHQKGRPAKKFHVMPSVYFEYHDSQGNPLDSGLVSKLYAKGYFKAICRLVEAEMRETYIPPQPRQGGGGQRQGNNQQQRYQAPAQSNNGPSDNFDNDIPM